MKENIKYQITQKDLELYLQEDFISEGYKILIWNSYPLVNSKVVFIWHHENNHAYLAIITDNLKSEYQLIPTILQQKIIEFTNSRLSEQFIWADPEFDNKNVSIIRKVYLYTNSIDIDIKKLQLEFSNLGFKLIPRKKNKPYILPKRLALIIGNSCYENENIVNLDNSINDSNSITEKLKKLSFKVIQRNNLTYKETKEIFENFANEMKSYDEGLFYYAGHGIQYQGNNYLVPTDSYLQTPSNILYDCIPFIEIFKNIENLVEKSFILILDACRDNPYLRQWSNDNNSMGLATMEAPSGCFIAFSTAPGFSALDGVVGQNSIFTTALLKYIDIPMLKIEELFKKVRNEVEIEAKKRGKNQTPWDTTSLKKDFFFKKNT
jgi:hypothetical protein